MTHGRHVDAELIVDELETRVLDDGIQLEPLSPSKALDVTGRGDVSYGLVWRTMWYDYRSRSLVGISLMASQAFLYNAIFFTDGTVLTKYYGVATQETGYYLLPFALGNFLGPLILGKFFDTIGRRKMLTFTYCLSGVLMMLSAPLFLADLLSAISQTAIWCAIFFFASAGASAAYLTVSEIFPLELRAQAISFFFAIPLLVFGVPAPGVFAALVEGNASHLPLTVGYLVAGPSSHP